MRRMDGEGGGLERKKEGRKSSLKKKRENRQEQADADTRCSYPVSSSSFLFFSGEWKRTRGAEWRTTGPQQLRSRFISHSAVLSFPIHSLYPSSLPLSPAVPLLFCLHLSSTTSFHRSLPPSAFMLLLIIALTSLPPSLHLSDSLSPTGVGLHPCVSAWTGPRERGGETFQMDRLWTPEEKEEMALWKGRREKRGGEERGEPRGL